MEKNKTGKYFKYAIGEIVLVVIGILIALQINNWNEDRKSKMEERTILEAVKKEFEINKADFIETHERVKLRKTRIKNILRYTGQSNSGLTKIQSDSMIVRLYGYDSADISTYYVDELIGSGKIHLLKNDSLKYLLANWKKELNDRLTESEGNVINLAKRHIHPFLTTHYSFSFEHIKDQFNNYLEFEFDSKFKDNYLNIYQNRRLENLTIQSLYDLKKVLADYEILIEISDKVIKYTNEELKK